MILCPMRGLMTVLMSVSLLLAGGCGDEPEPAGGTPGLSDLEAAVNTDAS